MPPCTFLSHIHDPRSCALSKWRVLASFAGKFEGVEGEVQLKRTFRREGDTVEEYERKNQGLQVCASPPSSPKEDSGSMMPMRGQAAHGADAEEGARREDSKRRHRCDVDSRARTQRRLEEASQVRRRFPRPHTRQAKFPPPTLESTSCFGFGA